MADPRVALSTIVVDDQIVGSVVSWSDEDGRELGYWIGRDHWGKGYATEAVGAFLEIERARPLAHVAKHNVASCRVLDKLAFVDVADRVADDGVEESVFRLS